MTPRQRDQAHARRSKAANLCIRQLDAAAEALLLFLRACNECEDMSESVSAQGKGLDSRETLARSILEYSGYLSDMKERGWLK